MSKYAITCKGGRTKQSFKDQVNINIIYEKAKRGGLVPQSGRTPMYMDVSEVGDYQQSIHVVMQAEKAFMQLPAKVRERMANDPGRLVDYLADPDNEAEAIKYGLINKPVVQEASSAEEGEGEETQP